MADIRAKKIEVNTGFHEHIETAVREVGVAEGQIMHMVESFLERCRVERDEARAIAIHAARERGARGKVATSRLILTQDHRISLEVFWARVIHQEGGETLYRRLPTNADRETNLRKVTKGARPEEVEVLKRHELEARQLRDLWKLYAGARSVINHLSRSIEAKA